MGSEAEIWRVDPGTLRDVLLDKAAVESRLEGCPALERVWILSLLGRDEEAVAEGRSLLAGSHDPLRSLLVLAHAHQRQYRWHEAATLHEQALRLAATRAREALVRHQIGRRLFDEARYHDAVAEFEWACDLYRTSGRNRLAEVSRQALIRARELSASLNRSTSTSQDRLPARSHGTAAPGNGHATSVKSPGLSS
ncbi:MAG TPA: tetratricopeptide repeat protein [Arthrobacter sp.]|nr:tetratricopeptide repeat protein [Arthrobacter sp.]